MKEDKKLSELPYIKCISFSLYLLVYTLHVPLHALRLYQSVKYRFLITLQRYINIFKYTINTQIFLGINTTLTFVYIILNKRKILGKYSI